MFHTIKKPKKPAFFLLLSLLFFDPALAADFTGKVVGVSDGDTIKVMHMGKAEKIRLVDIDCPEKKQPFGSRARQFTSGLVFGQIVTVQVKGTDRYGRTLGKVILPDGRILNQELLKAGLAWHYKQYSKDEELARLEDEAKAKKVGLWGDSHAEPPWEFRRSQ